MIRYYLVVYLEDETIHLMPFPYKEDAEEAEKKLRGTDRWGSRIEFTKIIKKDFSKPSRERKGKHWL